MLEVLTSYLYTRVALRDAKTNPLQPSHIPPISEADDIYVRMWSARKLFPLRSFHPFVLTGETQTRSGISEGTGQRLQGKTGDETSALPLIAMLHIPLHAGSRMVVRTEAPFPPWITSRTSQMGPSDQDLSQRSMIDGNY